MKLPLSPEHLREVSEAITKYCIERIEQSGTHHFELETTAKLSGKEYIINAEVIVSASVRVSYGSICEPLSDESVYKFDVREDVVIGQFDDEPTYIHWKIIEDYIKRSV